MDPRTGEYVNLYDGDLPDERFSVEVRGSAEDVELLSQKVKVAEVNELLLEKLRHVRAVGKKLARSGHPAVKAAGLSILEELD